MADGNDNDDVFVYMGGDQEVPLGVTHAIIDPSVKIVPRRAFYNRRQLVSVIFHDEVEIIGQEAFWNCESLRRIKMLGVKEIGAKAFASCHALTDVEFGDKLETIQMLAFYFCTSLRSIKMTSVRTIQELAFGYCHQLNDVEFGSDLETIGINSFFNCCRKLKRIAIPLKENLFPLDTDAGRYNQFEECNNLSKVDLVGVEGMYNTLLLESWRDDIYHEIDSINYLLPNTHADRKTDLICIWIRSVLDKMEHYKAEHNRLLKEHMVQLELAIWKVKLDQKGDNKSTLQVHSTERVKIDEGGAREEKRIMSGADIIIKNVIPFLKMG